VEKGLLTTTEAAGYLSCGRSTLFELLRAGELRVVKLGRATRISRRELDGWIAARSAPLGAGAADGHGAGVREPSE